MYWDAAVVLVEFLKRFEMDKGGKVLELGCGLGVVSISMRVLGFEHVLATDLREVIELAKINAEHNNVELAVEELNWFYPRKIDADLILFADCIWILDLVDPLVQTLKELLNYRNKAITCYKIRSQIVHQRFLDQLLINNLKIITIHQDSDYFISSIILSST